MKFFLISEKVRGFVICQECGKRRVVYSRCRLESREQQAVLRVQEEFLYVCGSTLFPGGDLQDKILVKESLHCGSPIETTYYSGKSQIFDNICFYCGDTEITRNSEIEQLEEEYGIVRPICQTCYSVGKKPATRCAKKLKKRRAT